MKKLVLAAALIGVAATAQAGTLDMVTLDDNHVKIAWELDSGEAGSTVHYLANEVMFAEDGTTGYYIKTGDMITMLVQFTDGSIANAVFKRNDTVEYARPWVKPDGTVLNEQMTTTWID